jgi:hypothetical protein
MVEQDAREFGLHVKQGGWRLGLLVARNVERGNGGRGNRRGRDSLKVSGRDFARMSGTTADRVLRYLDAWERAADAGHVPHAAALTPGDEPELDVDELPPWGDYYEAVRGGRPRDGRIEDALTILDRQTPETRARITTQLLADPDTRDHVVERSNPEGVAAVEAMYSELRRRELPPVEYATPLPPPPEFDVRFWYAVNAVQAANVELERFGVRGLDARSETRVAAERMAAQADVLRDAVVDFVVANITTTEGV